MFCDLTWHSFICLDLRTYGLLILTLHLFVGASSWRSFSRVPARAPLLKRNAARMASPPNEIPFFVIKAAMVAVSR